jgi:WD40 repeat protein
MRFAIFLVGSIVCAGIGFVPLSADPQPAQIEKPTPAVDIYGDPLPEGAVGRLGTVRFRTLSKYEPKLTFSPDAKLLASSTYEGQVGLWDAASGKLIHRFGAKYRGQPAFSKDGKVLSCAGLFFNIADGQLAKMTEDKDLFMQELTEKLPDGMLARSADGKFLAGVRGETIFVVECNTGKEASTFEAHKKPVVGLGFARGGQVLATAAQDGVVRLWHVGSSKPLFSFAPRMPQQQFVTGVAVSPDGKVVAVPAGDGILKDRQGIRALTRLVIRRFDPSQGKELDPWITAEMEFYGACLVFAPTGGTFAFSAGDGINCICSQATGKEIRRFSDPLLQRSHAMAYTPDGKMIATASDTGVLIWDVATGKESKSFPRKYLPVVSLAFSPDGRVLAGGDGSTVHLWELATGKERLSFKAHSSRVSALAFSPDSSILASGGWDSGTVKVWNAVNGKELHRFEGHDGLLNALAFSPDGKVLASASYDTTVLGWDVEVIRAGMKKAGK